MYLWSLDDLRTAPPSNRGSEMIVRSIFFGQTMEYMNKCRAQEKVEIQKKIEKKRIQKQIQNKQIKQILVLCYFVICCRVLFVCICVCVRVCVFFTMICADIVILCYQK